MRCLIIGHGIAGAVLAWTLQNRGVQVEVVDAHQPNSSSRVAAGIVNPVTGKRFVKSWRYDDFYPIAKAAYQSMEQQWGISIWRDFTILRQLDTAGALNDWSARMADSEYANILGQRPDLGSWSEIAEPGFAVGEIRQAARVDFGTLLQKSEAILKTAGRFQTQNISLAQVGRQAADYDICIFCEGAHGADNPFFPDLPWQLSKGEALLFRLKQPKSDLQEILKKTLLLAPVGDGLIWAGSSYTWDVADSGTTIAGQAMLEERIGAVLKVPFDIVQHYAAIRPTVKDRRPFLGASQVDSRVFIFNGLGTKGGLLAPYWAAHLADHILNGTALDSEVDVGRFWKK